MAKDAASTSPSRAQAKGRARGAARAQRLIVVGIGASAGGLEALGAMLKRIEIDNSAFVVVQHLSPKHDSVLGELLARTTTALKVVTITDGMKVKANHVYVIPPNADLAILHGELHLMPMPAERGPRLPIDYFFRSLAADQGDAAVGVILSGTGTDGCLGLKAIKAAGGMTFVQDPATAKYDGMPRAALESGHADVCLSPEALGHELSRLVRHPHGISVASINRNETQEQLAKLFILIRKEFGNDLTHYKHSTIERRIERRMALHKIEKIGDYIRHVQSHSNELRAVYKDILISVTSFFRDAATFAALRSVVFPRILAQKKPGDTIRIWTAGSSTGEEAYSVAITLLELLGDRAGDYKIQLFGTDVDEGSIQHARRGVYPHNIALDVGSERLQRFFRKHHDSYQVNRSVRDLLVFATQNLTKDAPFSRLDLATCRNVLIYLQPVLQKKVLRILHYALNPDGFLLLGTSETVGDLPDLFGLIDRKNKIYVKKNVTAPPTFELSLATSIEDRPANAPPPTRGARPVPTMHQLVDRRLLDRYVPPGVLINEALEILQYHGRTGPYLEPSAGAATLHVLRNTRPELQAELRALLHRARAEKVAVTGAPIPLRIKETGLTRNITIDVLPVEDSATRSQCQLVVFRESAPVATATAADGTKEAEDTNLRDVERELATTKDYLQSTIEELETSNEELKSSNEELQSSNEELQSTNEELETSKEELQSSNEELTTVNDELHNRMLELGQSNDDLANVLSSVELAVIIVGMDRRIRRFNSKAEKILNLVAGDLGRSVGHLASYVKHADLRQVVDKVITGVAAAQQTVTINESWFLMRAIPYMTSDHAIRGAVVLLQRIDEELPTLDQALGAAQGAGAMLVSIKHPLLILDEALHVVWANATFHEKFHVDAREIAGRPLPQPLAHPKLLEKLQQTATTNVPFKNFSVSYDAAGVRQRTIKVEGSVIPSQGGQSHQKMILMILDEQSPTKASAARPKVRRPSTAKARRKRT